jgi:hypothetical protein
VNPVERAFLSLACAACLAAGIVVLAETVIRLRAIGCFQ